MVTTKCTEITSIVSQVQNELNSGWCEWPKNKMYVFRRVRAWVSKAWNLKAGLKKCNLNGFSFLNVKNGVGLFWWVGQGISPALFLGGLSCLRTKFFRQIHVAQNDAKKYLQQKMPKIFKNTHLHILKHIV